MELKLGVILVDEVGLAWSDNVWIPRPGLRTVGWLLCMKISQQTGCYKRGSQV